MEFSSGWSWLAQVMEGRLRATSGIHCKNCGIATVLDCELRPQTALREWALEEGWNLRNL